MSWLKKIFRPRPTTIGNKHLTRDFKPDPNTIVDKHLGTLTRDTRRTWEGRWQKGPHGPLTLYITSYNQPPTSDQLTTILDILVKLPELWQNARPHAFKSVAWADAATMSRLFDGLKIQGIDFELYDSGSWTWVAYCVGDMDKHLYMLRFDDSQYRTFTIDGP